MSTTPKDIQAKRQPTPTRKETKIESTATSSSTSEPVSQTRILLQAVWISMHNKEAIALPQKPAAWGRRATASSMDRY